MKYWRTPLDQGKVHPTRRQELVILQERCKGCGFCIAFCPRGVLEFSADFNKKGYHFPSVIDNSKCANCRFCQDLCPEFAIYSVIKDVNGEKNKKGETP
jgi:2-oxoglutarate ferredoxin oxidoreductase subunit delta